MDCERCVYYDEDRKDQPCCGCHGQNFEEIERETKNHGICYTQRKISELKKKYTEENK